MIMHMFPESDLYYGMQSLHIRPKRKVRINNMICLVCGRVKLTVTDDSRSISMAERADDPVLYNTTKTSIWWAGVLRSLLLGEHTGQGWGY